MNNNDFLRNDPKPTVNQTSWVISCLCDNVIKGGTFRYLIYDIMGYDSTSYSRLYNAGGMSISNLLSENYTDIKQAAIKLKINGDLYTLPKPCRHHDIFKLIPDSDENKILNYEQGFLTKNDKFLNRKEAYNLVMVNRSIDLDKIKPDLGILLTEHLW